MTENSKLEHNSDKKVSFANKMVVRSFHVSAEEEAEKKLQDKNINDSQKIRSAEYKRLGYSSHKRKLSLDNTDIEKSVDLKVDDKVADNSSLKKSYVERVLKSREENILTPSIDLK